MAGKLGGLPDPAMMRRLAGMGKGGDEPLETEGVRIKSLSITNPATLASLKEMKCEITSHWEFEQFGTFTRAKCTLKIDGVETVLKVYLSEERYKRLVPNESDKAAHAKAEQTFATVIKIYAGQFTFFRDKRMAEAQAANEDLKPEHAIKSISFNLNDALDAIEKDKANLVVIADDGKDYTEKLYPNRKANYEYLPKGIAAKNISDAVSKLEEYKIAQMTAEDMDDILNENDFLTDIRRGKNIHQLYHQMLLTYIVGRKIFQEITDKGRQESLEKELKNLDKLVNYLNTIRHTTEAMQRKQQEEHKVDPETAKMENLNKVRTRRLEGQINKLKQENAQIDKDNDALKKQIEKERSQLQQLQKQLQQPNQLLQTQKSDLEKLDQDYKERFTLLDKQHREKSQILQQQQSNPLQLELLNQQHIKKRLTLYKEHLEANLKLHQDQITQLQPPQAAQPQPPPPPQQQPP